MTVSAGLAGYVKKVNNVLETTEPRRLAKSYFSILKQGSNVPVYVPNPVSLELKLENDRRIFFNVRVPQSELFP
jgi:hypothetical protein